MREKFEAREARVYALFKAGDTRYRRAFRRLVWDFYEREGRSFPWRTKVTPYKVLISEFMLQQTQTTRVVDYYKRFLERAPTIKALASLPQSEVIKLWSGLGYNRRALYLHSCAKLVVSKYQGRIPSDLDQLLDLPGIGPSTAHAIRAFGYDLPAEIIETNTRTVIKKIFYPKTALISDKEVEELLILVSPRRAYRDWYYALMDYGIYLKAHGYKLNKQFKGYTPQSTFKGSRREIRGCILKMLTKEPKLKGPLIKSVSKTLSQDQMTVMSVFDVLVKEGFLEDRKWVKIV